MMHFLYRCHSLEYVRSHYIPNIKNVYEGHIPLFSTYTEDELTTSLFDPALNTTKEDDADLHVHQIRIRSIVRSFIYMHMPSML